MVAAATAAAAMAVEATTAHRSAQTHPLTAASFRVERLSCFPLHDILYLSEELLTAIKSIIINMHKHKLKFMCAPNSRDALGAL